jgi:PDZ domain-containing protein
MSDLEPEVKHRLRPSRRAVALIVSGSATLILVAIAFLLPVPFVKLAPGPTFNVIGDADGQPVISIEGAATFPVTGSLDMTTVRESGGPRGGLTFIDAIASWFDPQDAVVPRELIYPDDVSGEDVQARQAALFSTSKSDAIAAALNYLELPLTSEVIATAVYAGTPADGIFEAGDQIRALDGASVTEPRQVVEAVQGAPEGTEFTFDIRRLGTDSTITVTSEDNPEKPGTPYIGIGVGEFFAAEFDIDFTLADIGGPSAGLIFATGIVDKLTPEDLAAGKTVAGTGTITPEGEIGPIGGIRQKLAGAQNNGAELFLMPATHCAEAEGHIPDGLTVAPVKTLTEAIDAIKEWRSGGSVAQCPTPQ